MKRFNSFIFITLIFSITLVCFVVPASAVNNINAFQFNSPQLVDSDICKWFIYGSYSNQTWTCYLTVLSSRYAIPFDMEVKINSSGYNALCSAHDSSITSFTVDRKTYSCSDGTLISSSSYSVGSTTQFAYLGNPQYNPYFHTFGSAFYSDSSNPANYYIMPIEFDYDQDRWGAFEVILLQIDADILAGNNTLTTISSRINSFKSSFTSFVNLYNTNFNTLIDHLLSIRSTLGSIDYHSAHIQNELESIYNKLFEETTSSFITSDDQTVKQDFDSAVSQYNSDIDEYNSFINSYDNPLDPSSGSGNGRIKNGAFRFIKNTLNIFLSSTSSDSQDGNYSFLKISSVFGFSVLSVFSIMIFKRFA